jgi:hypothetical protein
VSDPHGGWQGWSSRYGDCHVGQQGSLLEIDNLVRVQQIELSIQTSTTTLNPGPGSPPSHDSS